ncbi:MAG: efflux RND transporter periplasmic adaptor subunit [bacterium]|nr:efflux RND transporter periplasmic adaptor subunit [bacterium]
MKRMPFFKFLDVIKFSVAVGILLFSGCSRQTGVVTISGNGTIEATEVDISAKIAEKIVALKVKEGDFVEPGQLIATLDESELSAAVAQAKAAVEAAKSNLADLLAGARKEEIEQARANVAAAKSNWENMVAGPRPQEIDAAKAALSQAEANLAQASKDWERMQSLFADGAISAQQRDAAKTAFESAVSYRDAAKAQLDLLLAGYRPQQVETAKQQYEYAQKQLDLLLAGSRPEAIAAARARVKQAQATLEQVQVQYENTVIRSPLKGFVIVVNKEVGELVNVGSPIVTIADLDNVWLRIYVPESDIGKIKLGQDAIISVDSFPNKKFPGKVSEIANQAEFTPKNIQTKKERVNLVFGVKIRLLNPDYLLKPGMPADAEIIIADEKEKLSS